MRDWDIPLHPQLKLALAADARLVETSYTDDQIWELSAGGGEPPALAVQTTYGLRARAMRIVPRFTENETTVMDPADFSSSVRLRRFFPNHLSLAYAPFLELDVELEVWVPNSQSLSGRILITNLSQYTRQIRFDLAVLLNPIDGDRMAPVVIEASTALAGKSGDIFPVVFMTGGAQARQSPFPSLSMEIELIAGEVRQLTWCQAALESVEASYALTQSLAARNWEAETARIELVNSSQVDIYTGNTDWDFALALAQRNAATLLLSGSPSLPALSFALNRQPDQGYSIRGDGSDFPHLRNGQTPLDLIHLAQFLLPGSAPILQGMLRNFLFIQTEQGFIDFKPGLAGQRSSILATPLIAGIAWQAFQCTEDVKFLEEVFSGLLTFLQFWFSPDHDRDRDGVPEWSHPSQIGFEEHPIFSRWHSWAQGVEINKVESPALCAMLYHECRSLIHIAEAIGKSDAIPLLDGYCDTLKTALSASWNEDASTYMYRDRDTHQSPRVEKLGERSGPGTISLHRTFDQAARLLVRIHAGGEDTRKPNVIVHGENPSGQHRIERISDDRFRWHLGLGTHTGDRVYQTIEEIEFQGVTPDDFITLYRLGFCCPDETLLLPLWAGMASAQEAEDLIEYSIKNPDVYWRRYGIPACPQLPPGTDNRSCEGIHMLWNSLIGTGLLNYGSREVAADLVDRLMSTVIRNLDTAGGFQQAYYADTGQGFGEREVLQGLAPLGLFLETAGIQILSEKKLRLTGKHPFSWPLTVKYRGLTVLRQKDKTVVIFPDGQTRSIDNPTPQVISLEAKG